MVDYSLCIPGEEYINLHFNLSSINLPSSCVHKHPIGVRRAVARDAMSRLMFNRVLPGQMGQLKINVTVASSTS